MKNSPLLFLFPVLIIAGSISLLNYSRAQDENLGGNVGASRVQIQNATGLIINPATESTTQTINVSIADALNNYFILDVDDDASPNYYGYQDKSGNWYILKETTTAGDNTYTYYASTTPNYSAGWPGRTTYTYSLFESAF